MTEHLQESMGFIDRSDRVRLLVSGPDRAKFLHNLVTNDIKKLAPGQGKEAFVTTLQGKTLGYVLLHAEQDCILVRSDPGSLGSFLPHFQKFGIFEDVSIEDASAHSFEIHVTNVANKDLLETLGVSGFEKDLSMVTATAGDRPVRLIRESPTGRPGLTFIGALEDRAGVENAIARLGVGKPISPEDFEAMRIEAGIPVFGKDVTVENLPQEIGRDARTISFTKGCYLGQETVARLDALGHVNKILRGLVFDSGSAGIVAGTNLMDADGKPAGVVTSAVLAGKPARSIALAFVRTQYAAPGTELRANGSEGVVQATVSELPIPPSSRV